LFSPIIRSPLGRGGWGRSGPSSPPAPPPNAQQQREQAALAWQMAVHGRLTSLAEASRDTARAMSCKVTIDTNQRIGEVECADTADQAAPWTYLQGVLTAGTVAESAQRLCYTLADRQLFAQACPTDAPTP
jgi:hypothetical protein